MTILKLPKCKHVHFYLFYIYLYMASNKTTHTQRYIFVLIESEISKNVKVTTICVYFFDTL